MEDFLRSETRKYVKSVLMFFYPRTERIAHAENRTSHRYCEHEEVVKQVAKSRQACHRYKNDLAGGQVGLPNNLQGVINL